MTLLPAKGMLQSMSVRAELLVNEALQLTPEERAQMVDRLIASLDTAPENDEAWAAEVERRNAEIENGSVQLLSGPETVEKLISEFQ